MPSYEKLQAALNQTFLFSIPGGKAIGGRLFDVSVRIAMDDTHSCYTALFEMPAGIWLQQDIYRVVHPTGDFWELLMTPYRPTTSGACVIGAVFHVLKPELASAVV
jgi:hypothetical protein